MHYKTLLIGMLAVLLIGIPYAFDAGGSFDVSSDAIAVEEGGSSSRALSPRMRDQYIGEQLASITDMLRSENMLSPFRIGGVPEPEIGAPFAYAIDLETGFVFYQKGGRETRWPVASITKLLTALVAYGEVDPSEHVFVSEEAVATEGVAGGLAPGDIYTVRDLVAIMLITSSNDAAASLAEHIGKERMADLMNKKAQQIGMKDSSFVEPTGLSAHNRSTVNDLVVLMRHLYHNHPEVLELSSPATYRVENLTNGTVRWVHAINHFAGYSNFIGGKTGFIDSSGENLIALFRYEQHAILSVVLASPDRMGETHDILRFIREGYGF